MAKKSMVKTMKTTINFETLNAALDNINNELGKCYSEFDQCREELKDMELTDFEDKEREQELKSRMEELTKYIEVLIDGYNKIDKFITNILYFGM